MSESNSSPLSDVVSLDFQVELAQLKPVHKHDAGNNEYEGQHSHLVAEIPHHRGSQVKSRVQHVSVAE
jgi:hypothetical protein